VVDIRLFQEKGQGFITRSHPPTPLESCPRFSDTNDISTRPAHLQRSQNATNNTHHTSNAQTSGSCARTLARRSSNYLRSCRIDRADLRRYSGLDGIRHTLCIPRLTGDVLIFVSGLGDRGLHAGGRGREDGIVGGGVGWGVEPGGLDAVESGGEGGGLGAVELGGGGGIELGDHGGAGTTC
jgi:hypothetical protein